MFLCPRPFIHQQFLDQSRQENAFKITHKIATIACTPPKEIDENICISQLII